MESRARYKDWRWPVCLVLCLALLIACNGETAVSAGSDNDLKTPTPTKEVSSVAPVPITDNRLPDIATVVDRSSGAVVQIVAKVPQQNIFGQSIQGQSQGSGFFFDDRGYILTNNHVVESASEVEIVLPTRQRLTSEIVGTDPDTDLAVLKVDSGQIDDLVALRLGETDAMRIGDWVIAIGSPLGFQGTVTVGIVSAKGRTLMLDDNKQLSDLVQTDAVINPGNSGGPLLNLAGEVIGINTAIIRGSLGRGAEAEGIGFSISMGTAKPVSEQLIESGKVIRPRVGISIIDVNPPIVSKYGLSVETGVLVQGVSPGKPADRAGIQPNDVVVEVDGISVYSTAQLIRMLLTDYRVGDKVTLSVVRGAVTLDFEVVLEEIP